MKYEYIGIWKNSRPCFDCRFLMENFSKSQIKNTQWIYEIKNRAWKSEIAELPREKILSESARISSFA